MQTFEELVLLGKVLVQEISAVGRKFGAWYEQVCKLSVQKERKSRERNDV